MIRTSAYPRHRRRVAPDAIPTTYATRPPLAWLDVVPPPSGRYAPRHRRPDATL